MHTVGQAITGPTPITDITAHQQWMIGCQTRSSTGEVHMDTDKKPHAVCPTCQYTDTDTKCALQLRCGGWYHQRCNPIPNSTVCTACHQNNTAEQLNAIAPLSPVELAHLNDAKSKALLPATPHRRGDYAFVRYKRPAKSYTSNDAAKC